MFVDRSRPRRTARAALVVAVASLVFGCPAPGYHPKHGGEVERVLVLPLNVVAAMPKELVGGARQVDRILLDYLAERGKSVETTSFADAVAAWHAGEGDCRSEGKERCDRFLGVAPYTARRLRAQHDYDVLIVPYLLMRGARTNGVEATFDDVKRTVETPAYGPDGPLWLARNRIRAASLKVYGFASDGDKVFAGIGGLDVVDRVEVSRDDGSNGPYQNPYPYTYTVHVRDNLLGDPAMIREGVALALRRLVPRDRG
jgi:hypothetical protein